MAQKASPSFENAELTSELNQSGSNDERENAYWIDPQWNMREDIAPAQPILAGAFSGGLHVL